MQPIYQLLPEVQSLIDRESLLPKLAIDGKHLSAHLALLEDVTLAGTEVDEGHNRDTLSDLMYRLASGILVETDTQLPPPILKPYKNRTKSEEFEKSIKPGTGKVEGSSGVRRPKSTYTVGTAANAATRPSVYEASAKNAFELINWAAMAREWSKACDTHDDDKAKGLLVSGSALKRIKKFEEDDQSIKAFVKASVKLERHQQRRNHILLALGILFCLALGSVVSLALTQYDQQRMNLRIAQEKPGISTDLITAVQEINDGSAAALITLLKKQVDHDGALALARLTVGPNPSPTTGDVATVLASTQYDPKPASIISPSIDSGPKPEGPAATASDERQDRLAKLWHDDVSSTCEGALWLGNANVSRVVGVADPLTLSADARLTTTNAQGESQGEGSLNLRATMPDEQYTLGRFKGVVPDGAEVRLRGPVEVRNSDDGARNFWAPVTVPREFCTRIDLRYADSADLDRVSRAGRGFKDLGFIVPLAEQDPSAIGLSEIRYLSQGVDEFGDRVKGVLSEAYPNQNFTVWPMLIPDPDPLPETGKISVWLDFN